MVNSICSDRMLQGNRENLAEQQKDKNGEVLQRGQKKYILFTGKIRCVKTKSHNPLLMQGILLTEILV